MAKMNVPAEMHAGYLR